MTAACRRTQSTNWIARSKRGRATTRAKSTRARLTAGPCRTATPTTKRTLSGRSSSSRSCSGTRYSRERHENIHEKHETDEATGDQKIRSSFSKENLLCSFAPVTVLLSCVSSFSCFRGWFSSSVDQRMLHDQRILDDASADEVFLDNPLEDGRVAASVPGALGIDHGNRSAFADPE